MELELDFYGDEEKIEEIFQFLSSEEMEDREQNRILAVKIKTFSMREPLENFLNFYEAYLLACYHGNYDIAKICEEMADLEILTRKDMYLPLTRSAFIEVGVRTLSGIWKEERKNNRKITKLFNYFKRRFLQWKV